MVSRPLGPSILRDICGGLIIFESYQYKKLSEDLMAGFSQFWYSTESIPPTLGEVVATGIKVNTPYRFERVD